MVNLVPLLCVVFGVFAGWRMAGGRRWRALAISFAFGLAAFAWVIYLGQQSQGWDGIGYVIVAALVLLPVMGGMIIGAIIGALRLRFAKG